MVGRKTDTKQTLLRRVWCRLVHSGKYRIIEKVGLRVQCCPVCQDSWPFLTVQEIMDDLAAGKRPADRIKAHYEA